MSPFEEATGAVEVFDEPRGLGTVRGDDGAAVPFHCTAIADGTRFIEVGTEVSFQIVPGPRGRWEAASIAPS